MTGVCGQCCRTGVELRRFTLAGSPAARSCCGPCLARFDAMGLAFVPLDEQRAPSPLSSGIYRIEHPEEGRRSRYPAFLRLLAGLGRVPTLLRGTPREQPV